MTDLFQFVAIQKTARQPILGEIDADAILADSDFHKAVTTRGSDPAAEAQGHLKTLESVRDEAFEGLVRLARAWAGSRVRTTEKLRAVVEQVLGKRFDEVATALGDTATRRRVAERHLALKLLRPPDLRLPAAAGAFKMAEAVLAVSRGAADAAWRARNPGAQLIRHTRVSVPAGTGGGSDPTPATPAPATDEPAKRKALAAAARAFRQHRLLAEIGPEPLPVFDRSDDVGVDEDEEANAVDEKPAAVRPGSLRRAGGPGIPDALKEVLGGAGVALDPSDTPVSAEAKLRVSMLMARDARRAMRGVARTSLVSVVNGSWMLPVDFPGRLMPFPGSKAPGSPGTPKTKGRANVLGVGLLMRVIDQVVGYEAGGLARVANVPKGTKKESEFKRMTRTEEIEERESDLLERTETVHETDERSALKEESEKALSFEMSVRALGGFSASYGPVSVEASAAAETALGVSSMTRTASDFAKRIVDKATSEIVKRQLSRSRATRIVQIDTRDLEGVDNVGGAGHVTAIYQWIDEVHEGRLLNYGARLFFEFIVPEPGRTLMWGAEAAAARAEVGEAPPSFDLEMDDIDEESYLDLGLLYRAGTLPAPPEEETYVAKSLKAGETVTEHTDKRTNFVVTDDSLTVPDGYSIHKVYAVATSTFAVDTGNARWTVEIGRFSKGDTYNLALKKKRSQDLIIEAAEDSLRPRGRNMPILISGLENRPLAVSVTLRLRRTQALFDSWRSEVYSALRKAHQRLVSDYEEKRAANAAQNGPGYSARNPARQRQIEREEIKRGAIEILTGQHFDAFGAIGTSVGIGRPVIDFKEAASEGTYARFFETAFEWEQIEFVLYPYFWTNPAAAWQQRLSMTFDDPMTEAFMRAGFARVAVPVRPGFEAAALRYLSEGPAAVVGETSGTETDDVEDPPYVPVWQELIERQGVTEVAPTQVGDPWRFKLPTSHQLIRLDNVLPAPPPLDD
jgi:hypothetical protein